MLKIRRNCGLALLTLLLAEIAFAARLPQVAPDFSLPELKEKTVSLHAFRGQNVLLVFGTVWCPHCEAALPVLENLCQTIGDDELKVFFIAIDENTEAVVDFFRGKKTPYKVLLDKAGLTSRQYGIKRIPTCVFIDEQGMIQYLGRLNEKIVWSLLAGERPVYPNDLDRNLVASDRFGQKRVPNLSETKRFIVELDEKPWFSKTLSQAARNSRQRQLLAEAQRIGGRIVHNYSSWKNRIVIEIPPDKVESIRELPGFKSFKEDRQVHALLEDSVYQIRADYAWDNSVTGQGPAVCIVDTGIDYTHPDLLNKVIVQYNFTTNSEDAMDDSGHGTHCAGIIASQGLQYRGVSYDTDLMAAKVLDYSGSGYASDVILGINWCVEQGADIISLSLGEGLYSGTCDDEDMAQAVNEAVDAGVVVVCAAGNDGDPNGMVSPACASKAIAVGAVDKTDAIASYSDGGPELDLVAPGGDMLGGTNYPEIVSTYSTEVANNPWYCLYLIGDQCYDDYFVVEGSRYIRAVGTSMAAPHVAGASALILEANPSLTPGEVKALLEENADDLGAPGWDNVFGWGRINIEKTLDNVPPELSELKVNITEPNTTEAFTVGQQFTLAAQVDCFGGDGCGEVLAYAQLCQGRDCNDFIEINTDTNLLTADANPNDVGVLSGLTVETYAPVIFDANTTFDISEKTYTKSVSPNSAVIGSAFATQYSTGDLEPRDGVGAIGEDAMEIYQFQIPPGAVSRINVRLEHWMVIQWVEPNAGWYVYTSDVNGNSLHRIGDDCIPPTGGGGLPPPPDCWFISNDPNVLADLNADGTSYIKLISHDVGEDEFGNKDWLAFNDIEIIVEYEIDPNNDHVHEYYIKFDLSDVNSSNELTAAHLSLNVAQGSDSGVAEVYLVDNTLTPADSAEQLHHAPDPCYSNLANPIKSFSVQGPGRISLNVKAAIDEALAADQNTVAFQIRERSNGHLFTIDACGSQHKPSLTILQKVLITQTSALSQPAGAIQEPPAAGSGTRTPAYDTVVVRDVNEDSYARYDNPTSAVIGSPVIAEYSTGDLEPRDGIGAIGQDAMEIYEFKIPPGAVSRINVRLEHWMVIQWSPPDAGWYVYTSDANGSSLHRIGGDCIPPTGGGGLPPPPDCWFISDNPNVLADLNIGGTSYIKLISHDVGEDEFGNKDWLTFNDIEVIVEYQIDPNNDNVNRYYLKFDISDLGASSQIDSATLNFNVTEPGTNAVAEVRLVDSAYDPCTGAYTIYHAEDADYSSLLNPIKTFACDTAGIKQVKVKAAVEDAVESGVGQVAFLITEQNENALFTIDAANSANPPFLNVYLKSSSTSGLAQWKILPNANGQFTIRVLAENNVGITGTSDTMVINVYDPNLPVINSIECLVNSVWQGCKQIQYGDNLQKIRIDAIDLQEVPGVHLKLRNVPDDHYFVDANVPYINGYFIYDTNLEITDSGEWQIVVQASDSNNKTDTETITWNVPWGQLDSYLVSPTTNITVPKSGSFNVTAGSRCLYAECPEVNISVRLNEPTQLKYDDITAEDYGDIGSTNGYLAVRFTPASYPAQLKTARFYIWDETTYPFELHVWDDDGIAGVPETELVTPFVVDPVVTSLTEEVAWFDVDLSEQNIIINSGDFYIGFRQIEEGKLNQVGFDMEGDSYYPYARSWGYLLSEGWFNLDDFCRFCELYPWICNELFCSIFPGICEGEYCGNLMIRAITGKPGSYSGELPKTVGPAVFYTLDEHPKPCPNSDMNPGDTCEVTFKVYAVGAAGEDAKFHAVSANNYSFDSAGPVKATITTPETLCDAANLNAVGPVNLADFVILANQWLQTSTPLFADINADQSVDFFDLAEIAKYWLENCD